MHCQSTIVMCVNSFSDTGGPAVIKAQVLAGGRGKGQFDNGLGGVKLANR